MDMPQYKAVLSAFSLGELTAPPTPLSGGLMHRMYRVETARGVWALKCLNPAVMRRSGAADNLRRSERVARVMAAYVPAVAAVPVRGDPLVFSDGAYYLLYPWQPGAAVFPSALTPAHCAALGAIFGRMHATRLSLPCLPLTPDPPDVIDWASLLEAARRDTRPWALRFTANLPQFVRWHEAAQDALSALSADLVLSHRDLDPKNVLWEGCTPHLIYWEAAGPVNPALEFFTALRDWADDGHGGVSPVLAHAMLTAYRAQFPVSGTPWDTVRAAGRAGPLAWLAYNVRRACGIEAADDAERERGATQVCATLDALDAYDRVSAQLLRLLEMFDGPFQS